LERVIHRIWLGGEMPAKYQAFGSLWEQLNTGWSVKDWTESELLAIKWDNQEVLEHLFYRDAEHRTTELFVQVADVLDYELIYRYGGVYVNVDIEPVKPLGYLRRFLAERDQAWVSREDNAFVVNAAMAGRAGHPFYKMVIDDLYVRYFANPHGEMNHTTGPRLLTDTLRSWSGEPVVALPVEVFNPIHWKDIPIGGDATGRQVPATSVGVHHWGHRKDQRTNIIELGVERANG